jgi:hypothetical protein
MTNPQTANPTTTELAISHFVRKGNIVERMCKWGLSKIDGGAWITRGQLLKLWLMENGVAS